VSGGRFRAEVEPAFAAAAGPLVAALEAGRLPDGAVAVKESTVRTVHRVPLAGGLVVYLKRERPRDWRERAKFALATSRPRAEWRTLGRLAAADIDVPSRVLVAERRGPGLVEAALATLEIAPAGSFYEHFEQAAPAARRAALEVVAGIARRLHDAGFFHRDFHAGNMLVRSAEPGTAPDAAPRIALVDLQKVLRLPFLPAGLRARDLAVFCHDLREFLDDEARAFFVERYGGGPRFFARVRAAEAARRRERLRSRARRCVVRSTGFRIESRGAQRIFRRADVPVEPVLEAIERHRATIAAGPGAPGFVKRDHATRISRVPPLAGAGPEAAGPVAVKEFPARSLLASLQHLIRRHRGRQAWLAAHALLVRGLGTPLPLALVEVRRLGIVRGSFLLTRWVEDAEDLHLYVDRRFGRGRGAPPAGRAEGPFGRGGERVWLGARGEGAAVRAFARFVARLHGEGLYHGDLKLPNFLVREAPGGGAPDERAFLLLDLDALSPAKRLTARRRAKNLAQIEDYARLHLPAVKRSHRARFLDEYVRAGTPGADREARRAAVRRLAAAVEREVQARAARRARGR
jgi:tRNA A-37 threonylcarbamoyl transferase component Bud32